MQLKKACAVVALGALAASAGAGEIDLSVVEGLVLDLDASHPETLTYDAENGRVSAWKSRVGEVSYRNETEADIARRPIYDASANGGLGAVVFGVDPLTSAATGQYLLSDGPTTFRTVFFVLQNYLPAGQAVKWSSEFWGRYGSDDISCNNATGAGLYIRGATAALRGATNWVDGVNIGYTSTTPEPTFGANHILNVRVGDDTMTNRWNYTRCVVNGTTYSPNPMVLGYINNNYIPFMRVAEIVAFDRDLSDADRQFVTDALYTKWAKGQSYPGCKALTYWTGNAGTLDWGDAANWSDNEVPSAHKGVFLGSARVTVTGTATCGSFYPYGSGSLAFADGSSLFVANDAGLALPAGTTFAGTVTKAGGGMFSLKDGTASFSAAALKIDGGTFDLSGGSYAFRSVTGAEGAVVNSADSQATLTLAAGTGVESTLGVSVGENILVKKSGGGSLMLSSSINEGTGIELAGGETTVTGDALIVPSPFHVHLDATALSTLSTNETGDVLDWYNLGRDKQVFTSVSNIWNHLPPYYDKTAFGGRGGVRFGHVRPCATYPDGTVTQTVLSAWFPVNMGTYVAPMNTNLTMFIVMARDPDEAKGGYLNDKTFCPISRTTGNAGEYGIKFAPARNNNYGVYIKNSNGLQPRNFWLNGKCILDADRGLTNEYVYVVSVNDTCLRVAGNPAMGETMLIAVRNDPSSASAFVGTAASYTRLTLGRSGKSGVTDIGPFRGWIGEVIFCENVLSDADFHRIQRALIKKWGIADKMEMPPAVGPFAETATLGLADGATLDLNGFTQTVNKVALSGAADCTVKNGSLDAPAVVETTADLAGAFGALCVPDGWDLSATSYVLKQLEGGAKPTSGVLLKTGADLTGTFAEVTGLNRPLKYRRRQVATAGGLVILVR